MAKSSTNSKTKSHTKKASINRFLRKATWGRQFENLKNALSTDTQTETRVLRWKKGLRFLLFGKIFSRVIAQGIWNPSVKVITFDTSAIRGLSLAGILVNVNPACFILTGNSIQKSNWWVVISKCGKISSLNIEYKKRESLKFTP